MKKRISRSGSAGLVGVAALTMLAVLTLLAVSCGGGGDADSVGGASGSGSAAGVGATGGGPVRVVAVNYPLAYFAERIGGGAVEVDFPAPPDVDPAYWRPTRDEIASMQSADLILRNGADYAKWMATVSLPATKVVDTSKSFADRYRKIEDAVAHSHGPEGEHTHDALDFNVWLDPMLARGQARAVQDALTRLVPDQRDAIQRNFDKLSKNLKMLDQQLESLKKSLGDTPLVASHPVYGYLADRYGWNLESLHWEPSEMPSEDQWTELETLLKSHPAKILIWEGEPDPTIAAELEKRTGMRSVVFAPLGNRPAGGEGDYVEAMRASIRALAEAVVAGE